MQKRSWLPALASSLALALPLLAHGQMMPLPMDPAGTSPAQEQAPGKPRVQNMDQMKFGPLPGLPTCLSGAVEHGDPFKGPSLILAKLTSGCTIPWHWHTASEYVMMVGGTGHIDMVDAASQPLTAGGFARFPSHHIHQFICKGNCTVFIYTDAVFDIHYANKEGNEIPAEDALKPYKEQPGPAPKM